MLILNHFDLLKFRIFKVEFLGILYSPFSEWPVSIAHCETFQKYQLKMKLRFCVFHSYEQISVLVLKCDVSATSASRLQPNVVFSFGCPVSLVLLQRKERKRKLASLCGYDKIWNDIIILYLI